MGKYIRRALSPLIEMSVITLQFAYRSYPSPPLSTCPSISPSFLFVENMFPFFCPLLHLLSSLVPLCPTVSFHLALCLSPSLFTLAVFLLAHASVFHQSLFIHFSLSHSVFCTTKSLVLGQINKPSVAY